MRAEQEQPAKRRRGQKPERERERLPGLHLAAREHAAAVFRSGIHAFHKIEIVVQHVRADVRQHRPRQHDQECAPIEVVRTRAAKTARREDGPEQDRNDAGRKRVSARGAPENGSFHEWWREATSRGAPCQGRHRSGRWESRARDTLASPAGVSHHAVMSSRFAIIALGCLVFAQAASAQKTTPATSPPAVHTKVPIEFDTFVLVLLVRPPTAPDLPKDELAQLQEGHMANMNRLAGEGKLFKAGPVEDSSGRNVRGIFVLATDSVDTAREWIKDDPLIKIGRLVPEYMKWYVEKGSLK